MSASLPPLRQAQQQRVLAVSQASQWWVWQVVGWVSALLVPILILVFGVTAKALEDGGVRSSSLVFGQYLEVPLPSFFVNQPPVVQLVCLVGLGLGLAWFQALLLFFYGRGVYRRATTMSESLYQMILSASMRVAEGEGITAQRFRTRLLVEKHLPAIQGAVIARWRAFPRNLLVGVACTCVAIAVNVWIAFLAIISGTIVWFLYRYLNSVAKSQADRFDFEELRGRLIESIQTAPLVARVRGAELSAEESGGPVGHLIDAFRARDAVRLLTIPLLLGAGAFFFALLLLAIGGQMQGEASNLHLPAALVLLLALAGSTTSVVRIIRYLARRSEFEEASTAFWAFVDRPQIGKARDKMAITRISNDVKLCDVTMLDGQGNTLLDHLDLQFKPGTMVALMGTEMSAIGTLVELLMGFGSPRTGGVTIDSISIHDLHPRWLAKQVLWVSAGGPVWTGSIQENLGFAETVPDTGDLADATRKVGVYERLQSLSDGWTTLISNDDPRIDEATRYGLAAARAWLRKPAIVIVQEPPVPTGSLSDDPVIDTFRELSEAGSLVIVLPQRLNTLRRADRVILLNDGKLAGEGRHEDLLASSDLYRHLNYTLFNPYRNQQNAARR